MRAAEARACSLQVSFTASYWFEFPAEDDKLPGSASSGCYSQLTIEKPQRRCVIKCKSQGRSDQPGSESQLERQADVLMIWVELDLERVREFRAVHARALGVRASPCLTYFVT